MFKIVENDPAFEPKSKHGSNILAVVYRDDKPVGYVYTPAHDPDNLYLTGITTGSLIPRPTYRPFNLPDEAALIVGKVVKSNDSGNTYLVTGNEFGVVCTRIGNYTPPFLLANFTFLDGSPVGVKS